MTPSRTHISRRGLAAACIALAVLALALAGLVLPGAQVSAASTSGDSASGLAAGQPAGAAAQAGAVVNKGAALRSLGITSRPAGLSANDAVVAPDQLGGRIYGQVAAAGVAVPNKPVALRRYDDDDDVVVLQATTTITGYYAFLNPPTTPAGSIYYVAFGPQSEAAYVAFWYGPDMDPFTAGTVRQGGNLNVANVPLISPPDNATVAFPVTFRWTRRAAPADDYRWRIVTPSGDLDGSGPLGYVDQYVRNSLAGVVFGQPHEWFIAAFDTSVAGGSFGYSQSNTITFSATQPTAAATSTGAAGTGTPGTPGTPGTGTPGTTVTPGTGTPGTTSTPSTGTPGTPGTPGTTLTPGTGTPGTTLTPGTGTPGTPTATRTSAPSPTPAASTLLAGLTLNNTLIFFDAANPAAILATRPVMGLAPGENLLGIDTRPATGMLYGLSSANRLYTIDRNSGMASVVGSAAISPTLTGSAIGFDFNPTVDRIRVTTNLGQNLRLHPDTGAVAAVDGPLAYATGDPNAGQTPGVAGSAYTNNFNGANATTLYNIDTTLDVLVIQNPPNNGTLVTVGPLGANITDMLGFDIAPGTGTAYVAAMAQGSNVSTLHTINLSTGAASAGVQIGAGFALRGLAVVPSLPSQGTVTPGTGTPGTGTPAVTGTVTPGTGTPGTGTPSVTGTVTPGTGTPSTTVTPGTGTPSTGTPAVTGTVTPGTGTPGTATATRTGTITPGTGTPAVTGTVTPGTGTPGTGTPGTGTPAVTGTVTPGTGTPGTGTPTVTRTGTVTPGTGTPGTGTPAVTGTVTPGTATATRTGTPGTGTPAVTGTVTPSTGTPGTGTPAVTGTVTPGTGTPGTGTPTVTRTGTVTPGTGTPAVTGTVTPSTGTPGTGTPAVTGTVTPGTATATRTGTPGTGTPAVTGTVTPGTGTPTVTRTVTPGTPGAATPTVTRTATLQPTATAVACTPGSGNVCNGIVVVRAYIDFGCDGFFNRGTDFPLFGTTVMAALPGGTSRVGVINENGDGIITGVTLGAGQSVTVTADNPPPPTFVQQGGFTLVPCSDTVVTLTRDRFGVFGVAFVDFRYTLVRTTAPSTGTVTPIRTATATP